jgi:hypothetical protein
MRGVHFFSFGHPPTKTWGRYAAGLASRSVLSDLLRIRFATHSASLMQVKEEHSKLKSNNLLEDLQWPPVNWCNFKKRTIVLLSILLHFSLLQAQDIQQIAKSKPVQLRGYMSSGSQYLVDDNPNFQNPNPLGFFLSAGLNLSIYNTVNIPISITLSNQQLNFNRPNLQLYGLSPSYKWATIHAGYRTYSLSPYLMNGRYVLGGGLELRPGKFHVLIFYGDLLQDFNFTWFNQQQRQDEIQLYKRKTLGGSIGVGTGRSNLSLQFLRSIDGLESRDRLFLDSLGYYPGANFAAGLSGSLGITKYVRLGANAAGSALNYDIRLDDLSEEDKSTRLFAFANRIIPINGSIRWTFAYDAYTEFIIKRFTLRLKYQQIDPEYNTFGVQFLPTNLRNYLTEINTSIWKGKLNLNGSFGFQTTNTRNQFAGNERRTIINGFASFNPTTKLNISGSYNNFNSSGNLSIVEFVDTLSLSNTSESYTLNTSYNFGTPTKRQSLSAGGSINKFVLIQGLLRTSESEASSFNVAYSQNRHEQGWTFGGNLLYSSYGGMEQNLVSRYGLGVNISKRVLDKLTFSFGPSFNLNYTNGANDGFVTSLRGGINYLVMKGHSLYMNFNYINRRTSVLGDFNQLRVAVNYTTNF